MNDSEPVRLVESGRDLPEPSHDGRRIGLRARGRLLEVEPIEQLHHPAEALDRFKREARVSGSIGPTVLQNFANAGAGLLPVIPQPNQGQTFTAVNIYNNCGNGEPPWKAAWMTLGKAQDTSMATYGMPTMNAPVYKPTAVSQQALADQIAAALKTVKSCTFDLSAKMIKVDLTQLGKASVTIQGQTVPLSDTNGWHMLSETQLELTGSFCDTWRDPKTDTIHFDFPCDIIIPT